MFTSWSVGAAIDGLYEGLRARPGLNDQPLLQIFDAWPVNDQPLEAIWIADSENEPKVAGFRAGRRNVAPAVAIRYNDDYDLDVFTEVIGPGRTAKYVRDRVLELNAEVERFVAENTTLGAVSGVTGARIAANRLHQFPHDNGRRALIHNVLKISGRR